MKPLEIEYSYVPCRNCGYQVTLLGTFGVCQKCEAQHYKGSDVNEINPTQTTNRE